MNDCNKIKKTCTDSVYATCVDYQGEIGDNSKITSNCITVHDTTEDLYTLVDELFSKVDLSDVGNKCLPYLGEKTLNKVILRYETEICELKSKISSLEEERLCDVSIEGCNFDLGDLTDSCNEPITTFKSLIQAMLDQINTNTQ